MRVVRVGTHGLKAGSRNVSGRLSQHRAGTPAGISLPPSWGIGGDPGAAARHLGLGQADVKLVEADHEARVGRYIGDVPFLWRGVEDELGPASQRD